MRALLSVRGLTILLTASLAILVGAVTLGLSIDAWQASIDETKKAGDDGVDAVSSAAQQGIDMAISSGKQNVRMVTDQMMHQVVAEMSGRLSKFFIVPAIVTESIMFQLNAMPYADLIDDTFREQTVKPIVWNAFARTVNSGVSALGLIMQKNGAFPPIALYQLAEDMASLSIENKDLLPDGHPDKWTGMYASDVGTGGRFLLHSPDIKTGRIPTGNHPWANYSCDTGRPARTKGKEPMGSCSVAGTVSSTLSDSSQNDLFATCARSDPLTMAWTDLRAIKPFLGLMIYGCWKDPAFQAGLMLGPHAGCMLTAVTAKQISKFFRNLNVPSGSRTYAVVENPYTGRRDRMLGTSHGGYCTEGDYSIVDEAERLAAGSTGRDLVPIMPNDTAVTDPVIRAHATHAFLELEGDWDFYDQAKMYEWHDAAHKLYWVKVKKYEDSYGLVFFVTLLVPRDSAMAIIDARVDELEIKVAGDLLTTRSQIDEDIKEVEETVDDKVTTIIVIVVVLVIVAVVVSMILAVMITSPLHDVERAMTSAGTMNLDAVDTSQPLSKLREVKAIQKSFMRMLRSLKEYRNYMPQSLLVGHDEPDDEPDEASPRNEGSKRSEAARSQSKQSRSRHQSHVASTAASSQSAAIRAHLQKHTAEGVKKKKCSVLITNIRNFHNKGVSDTQLARMHGAIVQSVLHQVQAEKGVTDTFSGDRVLSTFGAVKPLGSHRQATVRAGVGLRDEVKGGGTTQTTSSVNKGGGSELTMVCVTGDAKVGNIGCPGMKKFSCISAMITWGYALERFTTYSVTGDSTVTMDSYVKEEAGPSFVHRLVDRVLFPKRSGEKALSVWQVLAASAVGEDEWMYQLEEAAAKDPNQLWNKAVTAMFDGELGAATECLHSLQQPGAMYNSPTSACLLLQLEQWIAAAKPHPPVNLTWH